MVREKMEKEFIKAFQLNDELMLKKLYKTYKVSFLSFARKYNLESDELDDVFQEAFIILRNHALSGKLSDIKSSMKTYLFGIAKNLIFNNLKRNAQTIHLVEEHNIQQIDSTNSVEILEEKMSHEQKILRHFFNHLGEKCKDVLTLAFYRGLTNEEIAFLRNYESEAVVRSQKSRCLKNLKELIKQGNKK
jgi:RNA polymerase sigma-70 factor (ECF subfamily)